MAAPADITIADLSGQWVMVSEVSSFNGPLTITFPDHTTSQSRQSNF